jgi:hypothetical protein
MAGPPGCPKPRQRALEALAEGRGSDRRGVTSGDGDRDGLDVARAERLEGGERGAYQVAVLDCEAVGAGVVVAVGWTVRPSSSPRRVRRRRAVRQRQVASASAQVSASRARS